MRTLLIALTISLLAIYGYSQSIPDSVYAVVSGSQVTIYQDNAFRNCGFQPNLENIVFQDGVMKWYQVDQSGEYYGCMCTFDYSVSIDSIMPGTYDVEVYFVYFSDTTYDGSTSFTVTSPILCDDNLELSSYAGTCEVSVDDLPTENLLIETSAEGLAISMKSNEKIFKSCVSTMSGRVVFTKNNPAGNKIFIPASSYIPGIYIVSIVTDSGQYNQKIALGM